MINNNTSVEVNNKKKDYFYSDCSATVNTDTGTFTLTVTDNTNESYGVTFNYTSDYVSYAFSDVVDTAEEVEVAPADNGW